MSLRHPSQAIAVSDIVTLLTEFGVEPSRTLEFHRAQQRWSDVGQQVATATGVPTIAVLPWQQLSLLGQITKLLTETTLLRANVTGPNTNVQATPCFYWSELEPIPQPHQHSIKKHRVIVAGDFVGTAAHLIREDPSFLDLLAPRSLETRKIRPHIQEVLDRSMDELRQSIPFQVTELDLDQQPCIKFNGTLSEFLHERAAYFKVNPVEPNPIWAESARTSREMDKVENAGRKNQRATDLNLSKLSKQIMHLWQGPEIATPELRRLLDPGSLLLCGVRANTLENQEFQRALALSAWIAARPTEVQTPHDLSMYLQSIAHRALRALDELSEGKSLTGFSLVRFLSPLTGLEFFVMRSIRELREAASERWSASKDSLGVEGSSLNEAPLPLTFRARLAAEQAHAVFGNRVWLLRNFPLER